MDMQMTKKISKAIARFTTITLIIVLLLTLFLNLFTLWSVERIKHGRRVTFGYFCAIIDSGSMEPTLYVNDVLIIKSEESYQVDDIIAFVSPRGGLVTHRVQEVLLRGYITKGDANSIHDGEITRQRVLGKVVSRIPRAGGIIDGMLSPAGLMLLGCICVLLCLAQGIKQYLHDDKGEEVEQLAGDAPDKAPKRKKKSIFSIVCMVAVLVLSFGMLQGTMGKYMRSRMLTDAAAAADFDVTITPPKEFWTVQNDHIYEYHFLSPVDLQGLAFQVSNNGETPIRCRPHINSNITYRIYVAGEERVDFHVAANETVAFWLVIAPDGLDTTIQNATLYVDIQQMEGGSIWWRR